MIGAFLLGILTGTCLPIVYIQWQIYKHNQIYTNYRKRIEELEHLAKHYADIAAVRRPKVLPFRRKK